VNEGTEDQFLRQFLDSVSAATLHALGKGVIVLEVRLEQLARLSEGRPYWCLIRITSRQNCPVSQLRSIVILFLNMAGRCRKVTSIPDADHQAAYWPRPWMEPAQAAYVSA